MRLRTVTGRYAGDIREYSFGAAMAALKAGTAVRLEEPTVPVVVAAAATTEPPAPVSVASAEVQGRPGRRRAR